jgi:branched-chain amino acid aminotransferase
MIFAPMKPMNMPSEHMTLASYNAGRWSPVALQPYGPVPFMPFALGLHYAQIVFEGMKAYRRIDDTIAVFRLEKHHERFNRSLARMCMPTIPYAHFEEGIMSLLEADRDFVPPGPDSAYYLRPFMIATEERMGLKAAEEFAFMVIGGPFRPLYAKPLRVKVERAFTRAVHGGTGFAKCAGNYAAAMLPTELAKRDGFDQVIWTDAQGHDHVEESGTMNLMFVIDGAVVTPALSDTILDGVTRTTVLTIARDLGMTVVERPIPVDELAKGLTNGSVTEAFGVGTAASVAPIGSISIDGVDHALDVHEGRTMFTLKKRLDNIRYGHVEDVYGWMSTVGEAVAR